MVKIIDNAQMAKKVWDGFKRADVIKKHFHLRPTNSGVTIVTTLNGYEMRGKAIRNSEALGKALEDIADGYSVLVSLDDKKRKHLMEEELKFKKRGQKNEGRQSTLEEVVQATMIASMSGDMNLAKALDAEKIEFVASEVIFEKGPHRIDIVGFDRKSGVLYFFELKKNRTFKIEQVSDYKAYYDGKKQREILEVLLKTYPIHSVDKFVRIQGVMVMKYAENSDEKKWKELKKKNRIEILFYEPSLSYRK